MTHYKNTRNKFDRAGTYTCAECGKRTRNVDGEASVGLCKSCYEEMENENLESDTKERKRDEHGQ